MCNFFSCIIHRNGNVYFSPTSTFAADGHDNIRYQNPTILTPATDGKDWLRVEIVNQAGYVTHWFKSTRTDWKYRIDDNRIYSGKEVDLDNLPEWYTKQLEQYKEKCFDALTGRLAEMEKKYKATSIYDIMVDDEDSMLDKIKEEAVNSYIDDEGSYEQGRDDGYDNGYEEGQTDGYESGEDAGREDGYENGYTEGHQEALDELKLAELEKKETTAKPVK